MNRWIAVSLCLLFACSVLLTGCSNGRSSSTVHYGVGVYQGYYGPGPRGI